MLNYKTYNESLFFKSSKEILIELRKNIIEYEIILDKLINLCDMPFKNVYFHSKYHKMYENFFKCRLHIIEKFNKILRKKDITQEILNSITTLWKKFEKNVTTCGFYNIKNEEGNYLLINTLAELSTSLVLIDDLKNEYNIDIDTKDKFTFCAKTENAYFICRESMKEKFDKIRREKHAGVDPLEEEIWGENENLNYSINELFDANNFYEYTLISKEEVDEEDENIQIFLSRFTFTSKINDEYYVRLFHYISHDTLNYYKDFVSIDFLEENQYKTQKNNFGFEDYVNTQKFDAIKIINTVFNILKNYVSDNNIEIISFNCDQHRYKTYKYLINKYFKDYLLYESLIEITDKQKFDLYSSKAFISGGKKYVIRKDNNMRIKVI